MEGLAMNTWEMFNLLTPNKKPEEKKAIYHKFVKLTELTDWSLKEIGKNSDSNIYLVKYYFSNEVRDLFFPGKEFYWETDTKTIFLPEKMDVKFWEIYKKDIPLYRKTYDIMKVLFTINLRNLLPVERIENKRKNVYVCDYTLTEASRNLLESLYVMTNAGHENFFTEAEIKLLVKGEIMNEALDELCLQEYMEKLSYGYSIKNKSLFQK